MEYFNLKRPDERASFCEAARRGLGSGQGLFHPASIPSVDPASLLLAPRFERYRIVLEPFLAPDFPAGAIDEMVSAAFTFEAPVVKVGDAYALELFRGPTLAFKDFGARFMAQCMARLRGDGPMTILTATSGDTGAAVAHAFLDAPGIRVVVLYPKGRISRAQEQLFCTLGGNVETVAVRGSFDDCQALVKSAFDDMELKSDLGLNSANSINICRLVAQVLYFWDLCAGIPEELRGAGLVVSVPSGNFGDLTAGLIAKAMGAPIGRFVAATNANDTVPRYVKTGRWEPRPTVSTASNAMDVSRPNNWPRAERLLSERGWKLDARSVGEEETVAAMRSLDSMGYTGEPHCAVAYEALRRSLLPGETGAFLCTAHPGKFAESVEAALGRRLPVPAAIAESLGKMNLSIDLEPDAVSFRKYLLGT
ncbi:MAG: threonine synthase [Spirochaetae bacterium HGW-Spirochaetae-7]|jgi:threonine synthase|nr:MAG: threonine synthase [Spirochaetae bacterium HGW-Spirochaetae-7]